MPAVTTSVVIFPFDLFGSGGTGMGATLVADELREVLADNRRERVATRASVYTPHVRLRECRFDDVDALQTWRQRGRQLAQQALRRDDFLIWVAGNHLGALPIYDELASAGQGELVVQFDAHLDIHHFADCTPEPSHGNFLLHCEGPLPPVVNLGHRELLLPSDYIAKHFRQTFAAAELAVDCGPALTALRREVEKARRVWIDIDWDVLDPGFFPALARPVPFGVPPLLLLRMLEAAWSPKVAGIILSEFDPGRDRDDMSLGVVMWLLEYLLLRRYDG